MLENRVFQALLAAFIIVGALWLLWVVQVISNTSPVFAFFVPALMLALAVTPNSHDLNAGIWFMAIVLQLFLIFFILMKGLSFFKKAKKRDD